MKKLAFLAVVLVLFCQQTIPAPKTTITQQNAESLLNILYKRQNRTKNETNKIAAAENKIIEAEKKVTEARKEKKKTEKELEKKAAAIRKKQEKEIAAIEKDVEKRFQQELKSVDFFSYDPNMIVENTNKPLLIYVLEKYRESSDRDIVENQQAIDFLIDLRKIDVNITYVYEKEQTYTPLKLAFSIAEKNKNDTFKTFFTVEIIKKLIEKNAVIKKSGKEEESANALFKEAIELWDRDLIRYLLKPDNKATKKLMELYDLNMIQDKETGNTALHIAAEKADLQTIEWLLDTEKVRKKKKNKLGKTARSLLATYHQKNKNKLHKHEVEQINQTLKKL